MNPPKAPKTPFPAFAIVKDGRRRGGVRCMPVVVETVFDLWCVYAVERITQRPHFLGFDRVFTQTAMKRSPSAVREKIRAAHREFFSAPAEISAAKSDESPGAVANAVNLGASSQDLAQNVAGAGAEEPAGPASKYGVGGLSDSDLATPEPASVPAEHPAWMERADLA